mmetsp:Transcript_44873/g.45480  ORF Transcript_44873/g.45480 Transcript_44873/m.45480 type:complete len:106 (-) Transcript_44873:251-568(-)
MAQEAIRQDCIYLEDVLYTYFTDTTCSSDNKESENGTTTRINFWGSPYTPEFYHWVLNKDRGSEIQHMWKLIPTTTTASTIASSCTTTTTKPVLGRQGVPGDLVF